MGGEKLREVERSGEKLRETEKKKKKKKQDCGVVGGVPSVVDVDDGVGVVDGDGDGGGLS